MESKHEILNLFGENVRKYRRILNISQEELAHRAELHRTYIGMIERGERNLSLINIAKLSKCFNITLEELFRDLCQ